MRVNEAKRRPLKTPMSDQWRGSLWCWPTERPFSIHRRKPTRRGRDHHGRDVELRKLAVSLLVGEQEVVVKLQPPEGAEEVVGRGAAPPPPNGATSRD